MGDPKFAIARFRDRQATLLKSSAITTCPPRTGLREQTGVLLEDSFIALCQVLKPGLSVEIGAHEAHFSEQLKTALPELRAIAFEANPYVFQRFSGQLAAAGVDYRHAAVCDRNGSVEFNIAKGFGETAFPLDNPMSGMWRRNKSGFDYDTISVPAATLDEAVEVASAPAVAWIDAEGAQREIIAGGRAFFEQVLAVYIELETNPVWGTQLVSGQVEVALNAYGLCRVMDDSLAPVQFNTVFVRDRAAVMEAALPIVEHYTLALERL